MDTLIPNNQPAPDFTLMDMHGQPHTLSALAGKVVILNFWSAECPPFSACRSRTDKMSWCVGRFGGDAGDRIERK